MSDEPQTTISASADLITFVTVYTCPEVRQNDLVAALDRATGEVFARLDGFVSAALHASLDQTRVVIYTQWRSMADVDAAEEHPEVREHLDGIMAIAESADPRLFAVRAVHHA